MTIKLEKLPPFQNVAASDTAVMPRIPMGEVYHAIILELGGTAFTKAQINRIKIRLGGKLIWDITGSQLDSMNKFMGMTANAAYLMIPFSDFNARTVMGESIGAVDTRIKYAEFSMECDLGAATAPTLKAYALRTTTKNVVDPAHVPLIRAMVPSTHSIGASGKFNLPFPLGSSAGALIKRLHLFHTNITQFDVKVNGIQLQSDGTNVLTQFLQNNLTRTTQAGHLAFDPLVLDNQSDVIPTVGPNGSVNNFEFDATLSASDTVTAISELYAIVPNL